VAHKTLVHICPHLGGGVGRVLLGYMDYSLRHEDIRHSIYCLEYANEAATSRARELSIPLVDRIGTQRDELVDAIAAADVVLIHFWNHPLLWDLLVRQPLPPARVLLWSHVAGHYPPQTFTNDLVHYPDRFVLASPFSAQAPTLLALGEEVHREQVRLVFTSAGIDHVAGIEPTPHEGFHVGYIGTVDYCKLHPSFLAMSSRARIPGLHFTVCGGDQHDEIAAEAEQLGLSDLFTFLGKVDDIRTHLASFDAFGYPLCKEHYGTGEQVLIEALAAGVPPVVLGGGAESFVVEDGFNGLVAVDEDAYPRALEQLYRDPHLRLELSANARFSANDRFGVERTSASFLELISEVAAGNKSARTWSGGKGPSASVAEVMTHSLGAHGGPFSRYLTAGDSDARERAAQQIRALPSAFRTQTRGSPFHYHRFFPDDPDVASWCDLLASSPDP